MDALAADAAMQYLNKFNEVENAYYVTVAVDGITFLRNPSANHDMKIQSYATKSGNTSLVCRVDILQDFGEG